MYKKFSLEELTSIQNEFIPHLYKIILQEKCQGVNDFFKIAFKEGKELFYFERSSIAFKISLEGTTIHMMDETEKIEVQMPMDQKGGLQDLVKKYLIKNQRQI
jgi:SpoU rRNA methylase family enzyme